MKNLKKIRIQNNLSQQKLANLLHISQQSVYKYENNITSPDIETLKSMADYFDTSIDYLVDYTDIQRKAEPTTTTDLNKEEFQLIEHYRQLSLKQRTLIQAIVNSYLGTK